MALIFPSFEYFFNKSTYRFSKNTKTLVVPGLGTKKGKTKAAPVAEKRIIPVESDPEKLVNFVCGSNILKQGQDVEIKPDSEYPDWLFKMKLEAKATPLEEMDQNTLEYWRRLRKLALRRQCRLMRLKKF
uniref:Large ribosomal subunit protein mL54 n=1 Tax=Eubosmina coregoni TaxID=186181 RepID=A0A4Y7LPW9_9CRUS|nr:EOG090X0KWJ [Eubosmina coregoni]SVE70204.1 EOG090X0KWJ [Eubosmina coregoni]